MTNITEATTPPVRKTVNVRTSAERAFQVFTEGFDTWWPRSHSIGKSALQKAIIEAKLGGRCYQLSVDGSECDWGRILVWEPERRIVFGAAETPPEGTADYAFEFLVEGRDGGGTVLRFVQSGFLEEGWEDEYSSLDTGWDLFFGNLRHYFAGEPLTNVVDLGRSY